MMNKKYALAIILFARLNTVFSQSTTVGNTQNFGLTNFIGYTNNFPLNIRTNNIQRARFTTGNALNSWLGNDGDGLRIFDPAGGGGNLDLFTSSNTGGNETHIRFGGSGQVSGQKTCSSGLLFCCDHVILAIQLVLCATPV
jgi:hypothetical protein